jgi:hypothetical protein
MTQAWSPFEFTEDNLVRYNVADYILGKAMAGIMTCNG